MQALEQALAIVQRTKGIGNQNHVEWTGQRLDSVRVLDVVNIE